MDNINKNSYKAPMTGDGDKLPENGDLLPHDGDALPDNGDLFPNDGDKLPEGGGTLPDGGGTLPSKPSFNTEFEQIIPWNGEVDRGRHVRAKWERNFAKIAQNFASVEQFSAFLEQEMKNFLRKDKPDKTEFLIKFLGDVLTGGVEVGEFIDSMIAGKGTKIWTNGRIQTDRIEVRGSMMVMELLINELHAMAGDYAFSDMGKIDKVKKIDDTTYKLFMHKDLETDVTNLEVNDVLLSIVNNLRLGGKDYYSSWFRPIAKSISENSLTVVLYPNAEVPGGTNYPPMAGYNVTRRGNAIMPPKDEVNERAQSWLLSSREGRITFLQNVYKPILEDYNYALVVGKLPSIDVIERLDLTGDVGIYAETVVCEKLYRVDYNGDVVCDRVDRGEWSLEVANSQRPYRNVQLTKEYPDGLKYTNLEQHTVYHYGCKWGCLIDKTKKEPIWNSPDWILLEGDKNYHLDFESTNGWQFHIHNVDTIITGVVSYGNRDISNMLFALPETQSEWLRVTGNEAADRSWHPSMVDGKPNVIHLTVDDMGMGWGYDYRKVSFIFRVFIPVGEEIETVENRINIKI